MSERYSRLFALPEDLYCAGSPVVIAAGTLLKDNQNGKVIAQLKLRSISEKTIKAVKVKLNLFDTAGNPVGDGVEYSYLDLNARRNEEFGQKSPVAVAETQARSYQASVTEVVFEDQSVWTANEGTWESLAKPVALSIADPELLKQYQMHYGAGAKYEAKEEKDLWHCTCGALNHEGETCHVCGHSLFELQTVDMEKLAAEKDARLAEAARKAAEEKAVAEAKKKKTTKILAVVIPTVCALVAIILLATKVFVPNSKYNNAVKLMDAGSYEEAIVAFEAMDGYKDSVQKIADCEQGIVDRELAILEEKYNDAVALMEAGKYDEAVSAFEELGDFKDSGERAIEIKDAVAYEAAEKLLTEGRISEAAITFGKLGDYEDARERSFELWNQIAHRETISAGSYHTVGLCNDGTVVATGNAQNGECDVSGWTDIVAVSAGNYCTIGLRSNGTVVATGYSSDGRCDVTEWTDIVAISTGEFHTVGLRADGTVVATGDNEKGACNVNDWTDIVAVSASSSYTIGLKVDGTVIAVGNNRDGQCDVSDWTDIVTVSTGHSHTVGLHSDGTVVAMGDNYKGKCNISDWMDIVATSEGWEHTVGLRSDGTVVAVGANWDGQCDVENWTDIVAISAGSYYTLGLRSDGTVVVAGKYCDFVGDGYVDVSGWTDIKLPN